MLVDCTRWGNPFGVEVFKCQFFVRTKSWSTQRFCRTLTHVLWLRTSDLIVLPNDRSNHSLVTCFVSIFFHFIRLFIWWQVQHVQFQNLDIMDNSKNILNATRKLFFVAGPISVQKQPSDLSEAATHSDFNLIYNDPKSFLFNYHRSHNTVDYFFSSNW